VDEQITCHFTSGATKGELDWPMGRCPIPALKQAISQSLSIEIQGMKSDLVEDVVTFDLSVQLISVEPKLFVLDHQAQVKVLMSSAHPITCLFSSEPAGL
jgi:hypothetical protein